MKVKLKNKIRWLPKQKTIIYQSVTITIFKCVVSIKLFTWNTITIMGVQDKNTKSGIKSKTYLKGKILRELEKLDID